MSHVYLNNVIFEWYFNIFTKFISALRIPVKTSDLACINTVSVSVILAVLYEVYCLTQSVCC